MSELPKRKVGLVSCSGEEIAEGTVTRLATLKVLESLRPDDTVTICLPLFLAGGEGDRAFARYYPTIAIDGCEKRCAARGTEIYSSKPAAGIVVSELRRAAAGELGTARRLNGVGMEAVNAVAEAIVRQVDRLIDIPWDKRTGLTADSPARVQEKAVPTCSCGSGIPVQVLKIGARNVEVLALPLILDNFRQDAKPVTDATAAELLETVRLYNRIPECEDAAWKQALGQEYASYCAEGT
ncbi:MAG TPA: putative zinc-binding protein [Acidobacteriota bacterium]|nr:putative zinc-binding protein [Acidobacteriota bacterium]